MKYAEEMENDNVDAEFEAMLTRGLEYAAEVDVPVDFAARVRAALPPVKRPRHRAQVGRQAAVAAAWVLAVAMFVLAPHAAPTFGSLAFDVELLILVQLAGIGYWLTARRGV